MIRGSTFRPPFRRKIAPVLDILLTCSNSSGGQSDWWSSSEKMSAQSRAEMHSLSPPEKRRHSAYLLVAPLAVPRRHREGTSERRREMADDESVKLQSGDNEVFSVSKEVACQAVTIKEMLEGARALPL